MMKQSVCIVGAGPAGLVSAKVLLQTGKFSVTVFEKTSRLGGVWSVGEDSKHGVINPTTPVNVSRFQVAFSDLSWRSVDLKSAASKGSTNEDSISIFPKAWQVNRYLKRYAQKNIPAGTIRFSTTVLRADRSTTKTPAWTIRSADQSGQTAEQEFDYLIMAPGFFAAERPLQNVLPEVPTTIPVKTIHSGKFRNLSDLFPEGVEPQGRTIIIIGGGISAGEAAGVVGNQLSDAQYSPDLSLREQYRGCKVVHVLLRAMYVVSPYLPTDETSRTYVPFDFGFFNLAKRQPGRIEAGAGLASTFIRDLMHDNVQKSLGGDQSELGSPALVFPGKGDENRGTVQVTQSQTYAEYVRSGLIEVVRGRVHSLIPATDSVVAEVHDDGNVEKLENIGAVIYAAGYTPTPSLKLLDDKVKTALQFDDQCMRLPLILEGWQSYSPSVPDLAFHGFYEGQFWGVMEMQARLTADRWIGMVNVGRRPYESPEDLLALRAAMQARSLNVPQYWIGDYLGYMEEFADALMLERNHCMLKPREGITLPARYLYPGDDRAEAEKGMVDFHECWNACYNGKYVARAVFKALQGDWTITRRIESKNKTFPSGTLTGEGSFHPRAPTKDKTGQMFDFEYLYIETGTFATDSGMEMNATRRYVYRYLEARDELSIWFVKPDNNFEVDYLFHNLIFSPPSVTETEGACIATADHLCIKDMYSTEYRLPMKAINLPSFSIQHAVSGPEKDYTSMTTYERRQAVYRS